MSTVAKWFSPQIVQGGDPPQSRVYRQLTNWLMVVCIILLTVNSARIAYRSIYSETPFVDEIVITRAHTKFLMSLTPAGDSVTRLDDMAHSSGIVGSGLGAAVFVLGGDLLHSRITVAALDTLLATLIGVALFRSWSFGLAPAVLGATLIWGLTVTTPFALPYWHGFTLNLGEFPAALVIGIGLLVAATSPNLATLIWGAAAWLTKPIYFPVLLLLTITSALTYSKAITWRTWELFVHLAIFLFPLVTFVTLIGFQYGMDEAASEFESPFRLLLFSKGTGVLTTFSPLHLLLNNTHPLSLSHLISRLHDPHLEWSQGFYTLGTKIKIVSLSLGSVAVTLLGLYQQRPADRRPFTTLASWVLMGMVLAYTYWWFMLHPTMWMRHFQPALYIGLGLWIFWLLQLSLRFSLFDRPFFRWGATAFVTAFVAWQAYFSWGISTRISDFPTQYRCRIHRFVLVSTVEMTCKKAHKQ